jgi:cyclopropane fatty-acyl-phospholipid synthase-like methyltransferase
MKNYDWNAEDFVQHSAAQLNWARELIAKLHLQGLETILDIGCGEGKVTAEFALDYSWLAVYLDRAKKIGERMLLDAT